MRNEITIDGLTRRQVEICDMLWECDSIDEVRFLLDFVLSEEDRLTALTLIEIIHMESCEKEGGLERIAPYVNKMIDRIIKNKTI